MAGAPPSAAIMEETAEEKLWVTIAELDAAKARAEAAEAAAAEAKAMLAERTDLAAAEAAGRAAAEARAEKAERAEIMRERACTELEAVHIVAERIAARRGG